MFLEVSAPRPPELPTAEQVVAYAELVMFASDPTLAPWLRASTLVDRGRVTAEPAPTGVTHTWLLDALHSTVS